MTQEAPVSIWNETIYIMIGERFQPSLQRIAAFIIVWPATLWTAAGLAVVLRALFLTRVRVTRVVPVRAHYQSEFHGQLAQDIAALHVLLLCADPAAGGVNSDYAFCTFVRAKGVITVSNTASVPNPLFVIF